MLNGPTHSILELVLVLMVTMVGTALELMKEGSWDVAIATHGTFDRFVNEQTDGTVKFYALQGDPAAVLHSPAFVHAAYNGSTFTVFFFIVFTIFVP